MGMYLMAVSQKKVSRNDHKQLFGISSVPQGIKSPSPRGDPTLICETDKRCCPEHASRDNSNEKKILELFRRQMRTDQLRKCNNLEKTEYALTQKN